MIAERKQIDFLPDEFVSEEQAADFWDTHSIVDYEEFPEPVDLEVNLESGTSRLRLMNNVS